MTVKTVIEEGVEPVDSSILSGSHMTFLPEIIGLMDHYEANDIYFIAGGIIPAEDIEISKKIGSKEIFLAKTPSFKEFYN